MPFADRVLFADRADAGRRLAQRLEHLRDANPVVVGLPRGGVPVAFEVARALHSPLDVIAVRKLGVPLQPELGMGALGEGDVRVLNDAVLRRTGLGPRELAQVEERERAELNRRAQRFRGGRPRIPLAGRTVVVVDDGIATGSTARAACQVARAQGAARVVLAVPVAPTTAASMLQLDADEVICLATPSPFFAIGQWYADFAQTHDEEVVALLDRAAGPAVPSPRPIAAADPVAVADPPGFDAEVEVAVGPARLAGHFTVPEQARGVVVFAHGSGSSRRSPRNQYVAAVLNRAGLGTLLFDLLTPAEEADRRNVFDVGLLAGRLVDVTRWLRDQPAARGLPVGYFGASTGAAAALHAAAEEGVEVGAVVSRGGRPDLAGPRLPVVRAPTLLIVGERDEVVLALNRRAQAQLRCENRLAVVPGATHLFEEPGTLHVAAELARDWLLSHLASAAQPAAE